MQRNPGGPPHGNCRATVRRCITGARPYDGDEEIASNCVASEMNTIPVNFPYSQLNELCIEFESRPSKTNGRHEGFSASCGIYLYCPYATDRSTPLPCSSRFRCVFGFLKLLTSYSTD